MGFYWEMQLLKHPESLDALTVSMLHTERELTYRVFSILCIFQNGKFGYRLLQGPRGLGLQGAVLNKHSEMLVVASP